MKQLPRLRVGQSLLGHIRNDHTMKDLDCGVIIVRARHKEEQDTACKLLISKCIEVNLFEIIMELVNDPTLSLNGASFILKISRDSEREYKCFSLMYSKYGLEYIPQFFKIEFHNSSQLLWSGILTRKSTEVLSIERIRYHYLHSQELANRIMTIVQAVHSCGIIHSDIKPSNFLVDDHKIKIIDFDISLIPAHDTMNHSMFNGDVSFRSPHKPNTADNPTEEQVMKLYESDTYSCELIMALIHLPGEYTCTTLALRPFNIKLMELYKEFKQATL